MKTTADQVGAYIEGHLFDKAGILYSAIDGHTGAPYDQDFITPIKVPRRAHDNPWAFWTYEDSILGTGLYIDALMQQYAVTGDDACL
ncbi:MAG: hypothetical protein ACYTGH_20730, partial [Planctomycetota bacterium]